MNPIPSIRNRVLLFSCVLLVLLLWLSISFLLVAYHERQNAQYVERYLKTESVFREAMIALSEERASVHRMTALPVSALTDEPPIQREDKTDQAVAHVLTVLTQTLSDSTFSQHLTFQPRHLKTLQQELQLEMRRLRVYRGSLWEDTSKTENNRDISLQIFVFNHYGKLIQHLEMLRHGLRYLPTSLAREMQNSLTFSNAAWKMNLANFTASALFEGYIISKNTAGGTLFQRIVNLQTQLEANRLTINQIDAYNSIDEGLHAKATDLNTWYISTYLNPVRRITRAIETHTSPTVSLKHWKAISQTMQQKTQKMLQQADENSYLKVAEIRTRTARNLIVDCALVILCAAMLLCALWIVRRLHYQATHDELTGLPNRRYFTYRCEDLLDSGKDRHRTHSLLLLDIRKFKSINDNFGQMVGDKLLSQIGQTLGEEVGENKLIARMDGDEFSILLAGYDRDDCEKLSEGIFDRLTEAFSIDGHSIQVEANIGFACSPEDADHYEKLNKAADLALYSAKQQDVGSIVGFHASIATYFLDRQRLEAELRLAIDRHQFELYYQPQFDLKRGEVSGVEALLRWKHPSRGMVSPALFIPLAEDCGLLPAIGQWVIDEAIAQARLWRDEAKLELRMSVNVSIHQFSNGDIVKIISDALRREQLPAASLEIEITESVAMAKRELVQAKLEELQRLGVHIALDDFGTGYSSLGYLQDLALDTLKIDRSFISKLDDEKPSQRLLLESIAALAHSLGFHTVAEGVETLDQLTQVQQLGIDTVQGFYFAKPQPAAELANTVSAINDLKSGRSNKAA